MTLPVSKEAPQDVAALTDRSRLNALWDALWEDLRHNAKGRPSGLLIITKHRYAIEREAAAGLLDQNDRLRSALERVVCHMEIMDRQANGDGYVVQVTVQTWLRTIRPEITAARDVLRGSGAEEAARNG